jgi:HEAT repeat protein
MLNSARIILLFFASTFLVSVSLFDLTSTQAQTTPVATSAPTLVPSPSSTPQSAVPPTASQSNSGSSQDNTGAIIGALGAISAAIIAGIFLLIQTRKLQEGQRNLEREKAEWEQGKLESAHELELKLMNERTNQVRQSRQEEAENEARQQAEAEAAKMRTEEQHANAYCLKLISELRNLKILDMSKPLDLQTVYVQVRVREEEPRRYVKDEDMLRQAKGKPSDLLRESQLRLQERATIAMPPEDALTRFRRVAIVGDPGAGKTTMLRHIALTMAERTQSNLPTLPIYVELNRFVQSGKDDLLSYVASIWAERYGFRDAQAYLEAELNGGRASLLLDGLDEVLGGADRKQAEDVYTRVADEVNRLATLYTNILIAITCRRHGWRGGLTAFQTLEVLDFDWKQVQRFIENWFSVDGDKAEGLKNELAGNLRMQTLAANPLILSLIAIVYDQDLELPERRAALYDRCVEVLLKEWDAHRGIKRFSQFTTDRKRDLLTEIAWHFHLEGTRYFPETELLSVISGFLPTVDILPDENETILNEIAAQYGMLKEQAHGWYGFWHLTLQEYFAAKAANEKGIVGVRKVIDRCHNPWWEEVLFLLAGQMNDASPLLIGILGRLKNEDPSLHGGISLLVPHNEPLAKSDDLFHNDLLLAARCLVGTPRIRVVELRARIIREVEDLLASKRQLDRDRAASALLEIGTDDLIARLINRLASPNSGDEPTAISIASAIAQATDKSIGLHLLDLLKTTRPSYDVRASVIDAIGALEVKQAVTYLLEMLRDIEVSRSNKTSRSIDDAGLHDLVIRNFIIIALGRIGDKVATPVLLKMIKELATSTDIGYDLSSPDIIPQAIGHIGDRSVVPELIQILLDIKAHPEVKISIASALRDLLDATSTSIVLGELQNANNDWQTRWLLAESLDSQQEIARAPLMEMLQNPILDPRVKVGVATTLGIWGQREVIPVLVQSIRRKSVPVSLRWKIRNSTHTSNGYIWRRILKVLHNLGDESVIPVLVNAFDTAFARSKKPRELVDESDILWGILVASGDYKLDALVDRVTGLLSESEYKRDRYSRLSALYYGLSEHITKSSIPKVRAIISKATTLGEFYSDRIIQVIGDVADDVETLNALVALVQPTRSGYPSPDTVYQALYSISKRAQMRITPDMRVQELSPGENQSHLAPI